jgi:site-specific DNA-cytosine methylase
MGIKILVACEESQAVTIELRKLGHEAFSCDILPCSGGKPEWHLQQDVTELLKQKWDMIIAFPPCTFLTVTGNRWFNIERYGDKAIKRHADRKEAIEFFRMFANADCDKIVIENPVGVMSSHYQKPNQIINPYQFGDAFEKKTCLWIKGLPNLIPTNMVKPPKRTEFASGKSMPTWYADAWKLPKEERAKLRSKTFPGIAKAMATQWTSNCN